MKFYKYHGAGNDFIIINNLNEEIGEEEKSTLAKKLCRRRFSIGADGLVLIEKSRVADVKMRIFNPDGSEPEMCGNAIRCVAKYVRDSGIKSNKKISVETLAGIKKLEITSNGKISYVKVNMGKPKLERRDIPALGEGKLLGEKIKINSGEIEIHGVNTGVPHAVVFVQDIAHADLMKIGRAIRFHPIFPEGANVNLLEKVGENSFKVRTYERGVEGETLACGTGIVASAVIACILGEASIEMPIKLEAKGGTLYVEKNKKGEWFMNGPAEFVFEGEVKWES
jgi:diaminopimelate epimerase